MIHSFIHSFTDARIASRRSVGGVRSVFRRHARAPEPTGPALGVFQILALDDVRRDDAFENELRHAVPLSHDEIFLPVVEQDHPDVPAIIVIDHTRADVDEFLPRQSRARRHARVRSLWNGDGEIRLDEFFPSRGNDVFVRTANERERAREREIASLVSHHSFGHIHHHRRDGSNSSTDVEFQKFKRQTGPRLKRSMTIDHRSTTDRPPTVRERIASFAYLDKSYPAAPSDPRDGIVACSEIFFTRSGASSSPLKPIVVIRLAVVVVVVRIDRRRRNARAIESLVVTARDGIVVDV